MHILYNVNIFTYRWLVNCLFWRNSDGLRYKHKKNVLYNNVKKQIKNGNEIQTREVAKPFFKTFFRNNINKNNDHHICILCLTHILFCKHIKFMITFLYMRT